MYRLINFGLILTAAALLCWTAPVRADHEVPYRDSVEGTGRVDASGYPFVKVHITGSGLGLHFGPFQIEGDHILNFTDGTVAGSGTYTTVSGSTIDVTYSGTFTQDSAGNRLLDVDIEFGPGTGRLAGVTGSAHATVVVMPSGRPHETIFSYAAQGTLTFPDNRPLK
jgi:hypothetical protein